jgi:hypothetical protein
MDGQIPIQKKALAYKFASYGPITETLEHGHLAHGERKVSVKMRFAPCVFYASLTFIVAALPVAWSNRAAAAEIEAHVAELVTHAKSSAEHQRLVKWYEQREDEVRHQAEVFRKLAHDYERYRAGAMTTACEDIAHHYDEIAQQFEKLAEQHRHLAAAAH